MFFYYYRSPEETASIERSRADHSNKEYFPRLFKTLSNQFNKDWYIISLENRLYGGSINAVYKKYPNVYICLDIEYHGIDAEIPKMCQSFKFFIDDEHYENIFVTENELIFHQDRLCLLIEKTIENYSEMSFNLDEIPTFKPQDINGKLLAYDGNEYKFYKIDEIKDMNLSEQSIMKFNFNQETCTVEHKIEKIKFDDTMLWIMKNIKYRLSNPYVDYVIPPKENTAEIIDGKILIMSIIFTMITIFILITLSSIFKI